MPPPAYGAPPVGGNVCKDFLNGRCMRGQSCKFSHEAPEGTAVAPQQEQPVCKDFQNGMCTRGASCRFKHEAEGPAPTFGGPADAELDRWRKYQQEKQQLNMLILAERHAAEQAAAEAQAAEERRLAAEAKVQHLLEQQRAAVRAARGQMPAFDMMAQSNEMAAFQALPDD